MAMFLGRRRWSTERNTKTCPCETSRRSRLDRPQVIRAYGKWGVNEDRARAARSRARALQALCRVERGVDDALIAGAAAQIARDRDPHLLLGRIGIVAQEFDQRRQHAGRAETALQAVVVAEGLLQRVQLGIAHRDALDRGDLVAVGLHRQHQAGARRLAVEQDRAGAAYAVLAAKMRAGEPEIMPDKIRQGDADLDLLLVTLAVDGQRDGSLLGHAVSRTL